MYNLDLFSSCFGENTKDAKRSEKGGEYPWIYITAVVLDISHEKTAFAQWTRAKALNGNTNYIGTLITWICNGLSSSAHIVGECAGQEQWEGVICVMKDQKWKNIYVCIYVCSEGLAQDLQTCQEWSDLISLHRLQDSIVNNWKAIWPLVKMFWIRECIFKPH